MRLVVTMMIILLRVTTASAQGAPSPEAINAAKELMSIISPDMIGQMSQGMIGQMWPQIEKTFGPNVDAATRAELRAEFEHSLQQFVLDAMQDVPTIYARYFTVDDLHQLAAFYKTPLGTKALALLPKVQADSFGTMMPRMVGFQQQLQGRLQAILQKHGVH
jgi:hypothetical protein